MASSSNSSVVYTPDSRSEISDLASEADRKLSLSSDATTLCSELNLDLLPLEKDTSVLVSIQPPRIPNGELEHVPSDIVLVIDVSGSMGSPAPLPDGGSKEVSGLSILDLTKHAARTILENLGDGDRLGIVEFDTTASVVQPLLYMNDSLKTVTRKKLQQLVPKNSTNLWGGIKAGLDLFTTSEENGNVQGLYVLTDGMPNYMCPPQGYVPKLGPMLRAMSERRKNVPSIHTFGFGYSIRSGLLQSIAECGGGNYAFIPDAGMIGTVFVHAVANLFTTYASAAKLTLKTTGNAKLEYSGGIPSISNNAGDNVVLELGSLQYGQSRDIVVSVRNGKTGTVIDARLSCDVPGGGLRSAKSTTTLARRSWTPASPSPQYHLFRNTLTTVVASMFPPRADGEHVPIAQKDTKKVAAKLVQLAKDIRSSQYASDPDVKSLSDDINGDDQYGQVLLALTGEKGGSYWTKWGQHYLPSLLHAHMRQVCNSFKDPGPLRYGQDSPLFVKCRDKLDAVFDNLPPPEPTPGSRYGYSGATFTGRMSRFNSSSNPCFHGNSLVRCANGSLEALRHLQPGQEVWTPAGSKKIHAIVCTKVKSAEPLCRVGELWVTPWHPIRISDSWVFPAEVAEQVVMSDDPVFSILLEACSDPDAHAVEVSGQIGVTLGHGVVSSGKVEDARAHAFFGDYAQVVRSLSALTGDMEGRLECGGVERNRGEGLVCGFAKAVEKSNSKETAAVAETLVKV